MPKNQKKLNLSRQKRALLLLEWATGFRPAGSIWVLLLALRGFSLVEVGAAEAMFHVVALASLVMAGAEGRLGVFLSLAVSAVAWNLQSGTREAVTYESMLQAGREEDYLRFSSLQNGLFRLSDGGAMLLAGATVLLGWRTAYLLDAAVAALGLCGARTLWGPRCCWAGGPPT